MWIGWNPTNTDSSNVCLFQAYLIQILCLHHTSFFYRYTSLTTVHHSHSLAQAGGLEEGPEEVHTIPRQGTPVEDREEAQSRLRSRTRENHLDSHTMVRIPHEEQGMYQRMNSVVREEDYTWPLLAAVPKTYLNSVHILVQDIQLGEGKHPFVAQRTG